MLIFVQLSHSHPDLRILTPKKTLQATIIRRHLHVPNRRLDFDLSWQDIRRELTPETLICSGLPVFEQPSYSRLPHHPRSLEFLDVLREQGFREMYITSHSGDLMPGEWIQLLVELSDPPEIL
ncbi:MAG TPA: hypothetical protein PKE63_05760 [Lacibacter sp.]|nr:hypothetical protein [Lacibacter sp.]HMO88258.1 hypothetical protein [Lacibacter sp.]HMP86763.1 hypothetical protein [Lacibacter sp.]